MTEDTKTGGAKTGGATAIPDHPRAAPGLDRRMLEALVCPITHGPLAFDAARLELVSRNAGIAFPIRDGIPIMLPDEARQIEA